MEKKTMVALPDDLLADVLGRLTAARSLAASRGVCKAWRDLIDDRQLLLRFRRLLPHSVRGLFVNYDHYDRTHFLSRPPATPLPPPPLEDIGSRRIDGKFDFILPEHPYSSYQVVDHCNGLVLLLDKRRHGKELHVCNPTTRWSARLPPWPGGGNYNYSASVPGRRAFLVFDPFVSPEYTVLLSPLSDQMENVVVECPWLTEWPPSVWAVWHEFSSTTGRWEEKVFVREGEAAGMAVDVLRPQKKMEWGGPVEPPWRYAAYWKGALYIHCRGEFVSRLSLLDAKYRVIKSPVRLAECMNDGVQSFLGRSEKGVYIAAIASDGLAKLRVWTLREPGGQVEWVPKDQSNLKINTYSWWTQRNKFDEQKYWILDHQHGGRRNQDVSLVEQNVCWDSDDDNIVVSDNKEEVLSYVKFLGFHPFKEVIFLCSHGYVVAFHLNSPKVQYLGTVHLTGTFNRGIYESFVYTPCLT